MLMLFTRKTDLRLRILIDLLVQFSSSPLYWFCLCWFLSFQRNLLHFFHFTHQFLELLFRFWLRKLILLFLMVSNGLIDSIFFSYTIKLLFSTLQELLIFWTIKQLMPLRVHSGCIRSAVGQIMILFWKLFHLFCVVGLALLPLSLGTYSVLFSCFKHFFFLEPNFMLYWLCLERPLFIIGLVSF